MKKAELSRRFEELTGKPPLRWQWRLFNDRFRRGNLSDAINLRAGIGKSMVMAIWAGPPSERSQTALVLA
jgi:CRISPR-associated endonuclease/helicase Cas3